MHHPNHHRLSGASLSLHQPQVMIDGSSRNSRPRLSIHLRHLRLLIVIPADKKALSLDTDVAMTERKLRASEAQTGYRGELVPHHCSTVMSPKWSFEFR